MQQKRSHLERITDTWKRELAEWALPTLSNNGTASSPFRLDPTRFTPAPATNDDRRVLLITEIVRGHSRQGEPMTLLDVGAGAGSSLGGVHELFDHVHAIEVNNQMVQGLRISLESLRSTETFTIYSGVFPEDCPALGTVNVVNASNVVYNVGEILPFLHRLDSLASTLVVIELTLHHPFYPSNEAFEYFHALPRPNHPSATDLYQIALELGFPAHLESYPPTYRRTTTTLDGMMTRLSLPESRRSELENFLLATPPPPNPSLLLWWSKG